MGGVRSSFATRSWTAFALTSVLGVACGHTTKNDHSQPVPVSSGGESNASSGGEGGIPSAVVPAAPLPNCAVALSAGPGRHCAAYQDGSVWCWGPGAEEGPSDFEPSSQPRQVAGLDQVERLVLGPRHACAVTKDGSLMCWGDNDSAQIDGSGKTPLPPTRTPLDTGNLRAPIKGLGLSERETCVVNLASHVYCRGTDASGEQTEPRQVDVAGAPDTTMPGNSPDVIDEHGRIFELSAWNAPQLLPEYGQDNAWVGTSTTQACVLKRWGSLWCEDLSSSGPSLSALKAQVALGEEAVQAAIDNQLVCALTLAGQVWCAGNNDVSQTGAPATSGTLPGAFVGNLDSVRSISVNASSACALKSDGGVWCWGAYAKDRSSNVPVQVSACDAQLAPLPDLQGFVSAPRSMAQRLAEAGLARAQAACACAAVQGADERSCVAGQDPTPNTTCLSALTPGDAQRWQCLSQALWQSTTCYSHLACTEAPRPNACAGASSCPPPAMPAIEIYCQRRSCTLDLEQSITVDQICDGTPDCNDGSDERNCAANTRFFECAPNSIKLAQVCDGKSDCDDSSDEIYCQ